MEAGVNLVNKISVIDLDVIHFENARFAKGRGFVKDRSEVATFRQNH